MTPATILDPAIAAVDRAIEMLRYDRLEPADLSAVIAGLRELFWHTTTLTTVLDGAYDHQHSLGHDHGDDPAAAIAAITAGLHHAAAHLAHVDDALGDVHNTAAHLHRR